MEAEAAASIVTVAPAEAQQQPIVAETPVAVPESGPAIPMEVEQTPAKPAVEEGEKKEEEKEEKKEDMEEYHMTRDDIKAVFKKRF